MPAAAAGASTLQNMSTTSRCDLNSCHACSTLPCNTMRPGKAAILCSGTPVN
jgi:hypothetical protein